MDDGVEAWGIYKKNIGSRDKEDFFNYQVTADLIWDNG